jgi:hypothetical protein
MRIGGHGVFNLFPQHQRAAGNTAPGSALLPAHLENTVTPLQIEQLDRGLNAVRGLPGGDTLLRALRAHGEATGRLPRIVLVNEGGIWPVSPAVSGETWRVDPLALEIHAESGLEDLACLYETMARPDLAVSFYGVSADRLPQPDARLQARWNRWAREGSPLERRDMAVTEMRAWVAHTGYYGGTDHRGMKRLLDHIKHHRPAPGPLMLHAELNLSGMSLRELPKMPPGVRALRADHNWLQSLKHLPPDLLSLRMNCAFPPGQSPGLTQQLLRLPRNLVVLELDGNYIGDVLRTPQIEQWRLPPSLRMLSLRDNAILTLPPLPARLATLRASNNCLGEINASILKGMSHLREADFSDNLLVVVPVSLRQLPSACQVDLSGNPLTMLMDMRQNQHLSAEQAIQRLTAVLNRGAGPRLIYRPRRSIEPAISPWPIPQPLIIVVQDWLDDKSAKTAALWRPIENEEGAPEFARLLKYLSVSVSAKVAGFRAGMGEWLNELAQPRRAELRRLTFAACLGASAHCEDRAAWTLNQLKMLRVNDDIEQGTYDAQPLALLDLGRQLFRLRELTKIAIAKSDELYKSRAPEDREDIEVHLGYQTMLRKELDLTLVVPDMKYTFALTSSDLTLAKQEVKQREAAEFGHFLCVEWQGWRTMLARKHRAAYEAAQERLQEAVETQFDDLLSRALRAEDMDPDDEDARVAKGPDVQRLMEYAILAPVTRDYLLTLGMEGPALPHQPAPLQPSARAGPWPGSYA